MDEEEDINHENYLSLFSNLKMFFCCSKANSFSVFYADTLYSHE